MQKLFSTDQSESKDSYSEWLNFCDERLARLDQTRLGEGAFKVELEGADVGNLLVSRVSYDPLHLKSNAQSIRNTFSKPDALFFNIKISGRVHFSQNGFDVTQEAGDTSVYDTNKPFEIVHPERVEQLIIELPRRKLEDLLGSARNFTGLTMARDLPTTMLVRSFFGNLMLLHDKLTPDAAERMATVGTDLIVASIAERMALETPKPLHGTVIVQRAKAYIEANLNAPELNSAQVAAALRVSVRSLQERFRERGRNVAEWIWQRRLEVAAQRLSDPAHMHLPLGALSYGCGFTNQAHFSRRFKDRYDASPGDYRRMALMAAADDGHADQRAAPP